MTNATRTPHANDPLTLEEPWASAFRKAGLVAPDSGEPSIQAMNRETKIHPSAISRIISGRTRKPRPQTVMKMAQALGVSFVEVSQWLGQTWANFEPWTPPAEANMLTPRQRDLVEAMIRELTKSNRNEK